MIVNKKIIKVLIVDDSAVARNFIASGLENFKQVKVIGFAKDAYDAREKILSLKPDLVTMDIEMPGLNGIDFIKSFLPEHPVPVVLVSSLDIRVFDALAAGAVDFVRKPDSSQKNQAFFRALQDKIVIATCATFVRRITAKGQPVKNAAQSNKPSIASPGFVKKDIVGVFNAAPASTGAGAVHHSPSFFNFNKDLSNYVIGLGASTGGTEVTKRILADMPADSPATIIVQHMPAGFTQLYAQMLNSACKMTVKEAMDGDELLQGLALVAPAEKMAQVVQKGGRYFISCRQNDHSERHCPSINEVFTSIAQNVKCNKVGILLTGMGSDGAKGLLKMRGNGAYTIGQDKDSSIVYGMPRVAYEIGAIVDQLPYDAISAAIINHINSF